MISSIREWFSAALAAQVALTAAIPAESAPGQSSRPQSNSAAHAADEPYLALLVGPVPF